MPYNLGPVKPWVARAAEIVGKQFNVATIYGVASRSYASDHPLGLALDFMVGGDQAKGNAIASAFQQNARAFNVTYVMWRQKIWSVERASEGWRAVEDRGSPTANHMDHVHVSFSSTPPRNMVNADFTIPSIPPINPWDVPGNPLPDSPGDIVGGLGQFAQVFAWLALPANWFRLALLASGAVLIALALWKLSGNTDAIQTAVSTVRKAKG